MIDFNATTCRICLEDGAIYPIFESNEEFESIYDQLAVCLQKKLEDLEGYPRNICFKCKNISETISNFIATFEKTCEILNSKIIQVKTENKKDDLDLGDNEAIEPYKYELQVLEVKPKVEKRDPTELLDSLSDLTVKRIKLESNLVSQDTDCTENKKSVKKKRGRTKKAVSKRDRPKVAKKAAKPAAVNKAVTKKATVKPAALKNNGASKQSSTDPSKPSTEKDEEGDRLVDLDETQAKEEQPTSKVLCDHCGATFFEKKQLTRHLVKHAERKFKCTKCAKQFLRICDLRNHKKRHENIRHCVCDTCGKSFYDKKNLNSHISYVHKKIKPKCKEYKCQFCERSYTYKRGVVIHERSVHTGERPDVCQICGGSFYDIVYLREHMRLHTGDAPYKCPVCARGYAQRGNMKSHMRNHKISELDPDTLAKIKPNHLKFMRLLYLKPLESLNKKGIKNKQSEAIAQIPKLCDLCGLVCKHAESLARHKVTAHQERAHKCTLCPKTFSTKRRLKLHSLIFHEKVRTATCDYCGKSFYAKWELKKHINAVHFKKRKICTYKCEFCEKTFKYKKGVIIHERAVHTGERPATCDVCGNSFYDETYLKEHMRLHTGDTPYKCPVCARGYAQRGNMKSHMRNHKISELDPDTLAKIKPSYLKFMRP